LLTGLLKKKKKKTAHTPPEASASAVTVTAEKAVEPAKAASPEAVAASVGA
jgi:hypothetical protein